MDFDDSLNQVRFPNFRIHNFSHIIIRVIFHWNWKFDATISHGSCYFTVFWVQSHENSKIWMFSNDFWFIVETNSLFGNQENSVGLQHWIQSIQRWLCQINMLQSNEISKPDRLYNNWIGPFKSTTTIEDHSRVGQNFFKFLEFEQNWLEIAGIFFGIWWIFLVVIFDGIQYLFQQFHVLSELALALENAIEYKVDF